MSELTREQVTNILCRFGVDLRAEWLDDWKAIAETDAALRAKLEAMEKDRHAPTATYWMNMFLQEQQEAKKRFDDWFVIAAERDLLRVQLGAAQDTIKQLRETITYLEQERETQP